MTRTFQKTPMKHYQNKGIGKKVIIVSMGNSFEDQVDIIKQNQGKVDILAVDKAFVPLMERGIKPDYVLEADAQVSYQCYCEPFVKETKDIVLIANAQSNPDWGGNWKGDKTYYVNEDNIETQKEFSPMSGVYDLLPAASNVSNAAAVYARMVLNYDSIILVGFDFCWDMGEKFYSFASGNEKFGNKSISLNDLRVFDLNNKMVCTSENLWFSSRWLDNFINVYGGFVNASKGILRNAPFVNLESELQSIVNYQRQLTEQEIALVNKKTIEINSEDSFKTARELMNNDEVEIIGGSIDFMFTADNSAQKSIKSK